MSMSLSISGTGNSIMSDLRELALQTQIIPLQAQQLPSIIPEENESGDTPIMSLPAPPSMPAHQGIKDGALFPGFEVAGTIESLGSEIDASSCNFKLGQRVILYPYEGAPAGLSEQMVVPELKYLVPIPDTLQLSVAAMLPTGALLAQSIVLAAHKIVADVLAQRAESEICKILIVGTGGLALWAVRIAADHFYHVDYRHRVQITVASLRDEGFQQISEEFEG
jgi:D-arabinose 1-dehydrogenase-like Zn-dependent alcohol dehydrogenase